MVYDIQRTWDDVILDLEDGRWFFSRRALETSMATMEHMRETGIPAPYVSLGGFLEFVWKPDEFSDDEARIVFHGGNEAPRAGSGYYSYEVSSDQGKIHSVVHHVETIEFDDVVDAYDKINEWISELTRRGEESNEPG